MSVESSSKEDVQVSVGKDVSTATIDGFKVEFSPDGNMVVYTNDGVRTLPAAAAARSIIEGTGTQISISKDFSLIVLNGATIDRTADGSVIVYTNGSVKIKPGPANDTAKTKASPEIGDKMPDGTIYAAISPDTNKPMYATPADAPLTYSFNQAQKYAAQLDAHGHHDFRVPSEGELNVLYENRNKGLLKGTFNETGSNPAGWYWSSSQDDDIGCARRLMDGRGNYFRKTHLWSLRCVR